MKYLNLVKVHIESMSSNSIMGIPMQKLKQENAFKIWEFKLAPNSKEWGLPTLYCWNMQKLLSDLQLPSSFMI